MDRRTVVVTGAARGIGKEIARALAAGGARVALLDLLAEELAATVDGLESEGLDVAGYRADITSPQEVADASAAILRDLGHVEVLINNAGTLSVIGPVWESEPDRWFRDVRVNLYGTYLMCRAFAGLMAERRRGYIINMASAGGVSDAHAHMTSYAVSKTGVVRLTEGLARELEEAGVKVFAIGPPAILTDMTRFILDDEGGRRWRPAFKEIFDRGEDAKPGLVADLVRKLVGGAADRLSGCFIPATANLERLVEQIDEIEAGDLYRLRIRRLPDA